MSCRWRSPRLKMHEVRIVVCAGFFRLAGVTDGNARDRDDGVGQRQNSFEAVNSLFPWMHTQPTGTQAENVSGQQEILNRRRAILKQEIGRASCRERV